MDVLGDLSSEGLARSLFQRCGRRWPVSGCLSGSGSHSTRFEIDI